MNLISLKLCLLNQYLLTENYRGHHGVLTQVDINSKLKLAKSLLASLSLTKK